MPAIRHFRELVQMRGSAPELLPMFECQNLLRKEARRDDDGWSPPRAQFAANGGRFAKPQKQARNRKDLKGLKCHYTFGIRTGKTGLAARR